MPVKVSIVEDLAEVREGLKDLVRSDKDLLLLEAFEDAESAIEQIIRDQPDIVIMDINMPVVDGIEATRRLNRELPHISVIGLSVDNNKQMEEMMRKAGAASFLTKDTAIEKIHETILEVLQSPIE